MVGRGEEVVGCALLAVPGRIIFSYLRSGLLLPATLRESDCNLKGTRDQKDFMSSRNKQCGLPPVHKRVTEQGEAMAGLTHASTGLCAESLLKKGMPAASDHTVIQASLA